MIGMTKVLGLGATFAFVTALTATPAKADPVELRLATLAPEGSPWLAVFDKAGQEIKEKTGGKDGQTPRVTMKYFAGGQQGDERDYVRKIKLGQLDGASVTSIGLSMIDESIRVLEVPRLFESVEEVDYVADKMWPYFQKKFEKKGFKLNDRGEVGWIYFMSQGKVDSIDGLKGQKIWQWGDDALVGAMFKKLSLNGVPLGVPEVLAALTSGRIAACYGSPVAAVALQWNTKVKYMTSMPMSFAIGATIISLDAIKKMTPEDAKAVEEIGKSSAKKLRKVIRAANEDAKKAMIKKGVTVVTTPPEMIASFTKQAGEVQGELVGKVYSKEELAMVIKFRDEFRAKGKK